MFLKHKHSYKWLWLGLLLALLVIYGSEIGPAYAGLVNGVEAKKNGTDAVELQLTTDQSGIVKVVIGANKIKFRVQGGSMLDTGSLKVSGSDDVIEIFENDKLVCRIPVDAVPIGAYKKFWCDECPPSVRASRSPSPNANGWNNSNVTITVTADDKSGECAPSGIAAIYHKIGTRSSVRVGTNRLTVSQDGQVATYSFQVSEEGTQYVSFWARDKAENESTHERLTVKIDKGKPSIYVSKPSGTYTDSLSVSWRASDNLSGIGSCKVYVDGDYYSSSREGSHTFGPGSHSIRVEATDKAGNTTSTSRSYKIEKPKEEAFFKVTDLSVSDRNPDVGDYVTGTATIKNTGDLSATKTVTLYLDNSPINSGSFTLSPGQSKTLSATGSMSSVGTHTIKVRTPDDSRSTTITVTPTPSKPAEFEMSNLTISPSSPEVGDTVSISAKVTNTGDSSDGQYIRLRIGSSEKGKKRITLSGGKSTIVRFSHTFDSSGSYYVKVKSDDDHVSRTVEVTQPSEGPSIGFNIDFPFFHIHIGTPSEGESPSEPSGGGHAPKVWVDFFNVVHSGGVVGHLYGGSLHFECTVTVNYEDQDGDITRLYKEARHTSGARIGESSRGPGIRGRTSGSFSETVRITTSNSGTFCEGYFIINFTLKDAAGNYSSPYRVEIPISGCVG